MSSGWTHETPIPCDWESWLNQHAPGWLLFARQQARFEADAQDLVQEAVVAAWRQHADGGPPHPAAVFAAIRRRAVDSARSQDRRAHRELAAAEDPTQCWFDPSPEDRERALLIQNAMRALPDTFREVVTLKIWGGLTFAEIATALDIPANTAASRYRYGLEQLRKLTKEILA